SNGPFLCSVAFQIIQGTTQYTNVLLGTPDNSSFCSDLLIPQTLSISQRSGTGFDDKQAFTLVWETSNRIDVAAAPHSLTITSGPSGSPNPVTSGGTANLSVTAIDSLGLPITYTWTQACDGLPSGSFNNPGAQNPTWSAPANNTGIAHTCSLQVTASSQGASD